MPPTTYHLRNESGIEVFTGTITPAPGGGSISTREQAGGDDLLVNAGDLQPLLWTPKVAGDDLLDLSAPTAPTVLATGVYAVAVTVAADEPFTVGISLPVQLELDANGEDPIVYGLSPAADATNTNPQVLLAMTYYVPIGGAIKVSATNQDVAARNIHIQSGVVQRIS